MSFNITVVAFDREPDYSEENILDYRGFDPELVGKESHGTQHFYTVKTEVEGANIMHVRFRDEVVDSPNMVLVFQNGFPEDSMEQTGVPPGMMDRTTEILKETMIRLGIHSRDQMSGPWFACDVMAITFLDVGKELSDDIANAERREIFKKQ